ncbi:exo-beta-N-acetylmuramidase NamZ domain-containing protein [Streptomyces sp. NPDC001380]|uniref:exo-beta-N-acetylmuramidase NamZ family protein n=1 Tax=Streptomyces sp. NPDC001380 TaxID=3364566 RepID=UPI0036CFF7D6
MTGPGAPAPRPRVTTGLEVLAEDGFRLLEGRRVGLLTHPAAVLPDLRHGLDALLGAGVEVAAVFGTEHGFRGTAQASASEDDRTDPATGLRVYDTYERGVPELAAMLAESGAEVLVVDLQHTGARFYTYESALHDALAAAAPAGVAVVVPDRPNPVGGLAVAGPVLDPAHASFVGRAAVPVRHGMTMGELAGLFCALLDVPPAEVVPMRGWRRADLFPATGLPWVPPSPNMPTPATALAYPGTCLLEGTELSLGRGTTTPFELCGAPWIDGRLARRMNGRGLPGVRFREAYFTPASDTLAGERLCGVQLHVTDPAVFEPVRTGLELLTAVRDLWPDRLVLRPRMLDLLSGSSRLRLALEAGASAEETAASWQPELEAFAAVRARHLLYPAE